jgi:hypothetical protein
MRGAHRAWAIADWRSYRSEGRALQTYEGTTCPACARLHFINRKTGVVLGQDGE